MIVGSPVDGTRLFGDGVGAKIKRQLLDECNLHSIVRLPPGVFEPYTDIPSNILFFEKTGHTKEVWFYEIPAPEGRKKYSKTKPMQFEEFADCQTWWDDRTEHRFAWRVPIAAIESTGYNLDSRNPHSAGDLGHLPPVELIDEALAAEDLVVHMLHALRNQSAGAQQPATAASAWPAVGKRSNWGTS